MCATFTVVLQGHSKEIPLYYGLLEENVCGVICYIAVFQTYWNFIYKKG